MRGQGKQTGLYKSPEARARVLERYELVLRDWPRMAGAELERISVPTRAGETTVLAFGPAAGGVEGSRGRAISAEFLAPRRPLMLLHGTLSNSGMWLADAKRLCAGRRVYAIDIPGEPGLSEERRLPWEAEAAGAWLTDVASGLGLRGARGGGDGEGGEATHDLVGLSIGGWIALAYATRRPPELGALALLCPSGIGRTRPSFMWKAAIASLRGERGLERLTRSLYGEVEPPEGAVEAGLLMSSSTNPRLEEPPRFSDAELAAIAAPILLAVGEKDELLDSRESAARIGRLTPEAEIALLPGYGHALIGFSPLILEFLDRQG